ncbi:NAC transcription factor 25-like isoform X1 [Rosa chinensis]|nr:NAC transcription factor 25-like isoform X1 [Rosa chinensis]
MYPRIREIEWYFFSSRDRRYPNGSRPNRSAKGGYWKATKRDEIITAQGGEEIGFKMHLEFYEGTHAQGRKTNWKMHEYRIKEENEENDIGPPQNTNKGEGISMRLDDWVLCKIYIKKNFKADTDSNSSKTSDNSDQVVLPVTNVTTSPDCQNKLAIQHEVQDQSLNASQFDHNGFSTLTNYRDVESSSSNFWNQNYTDDYDTYLMQMSRDPSSSRFFSSPFPLQSSTDQICAELEPVDDKISEVDPSSMLPAHVRECDENISKNKNQNYTDDYDTYLMQMSRDPSSSRLFSSPFPLQSSTDQICAGLKPVDDKISEVDPSSIVLPAHVREYDNRACKAEPIQPAVRDEGDDHVSK